MADEDEITPPAPSKLPLILAAVGALVVGAGGGFAGAMMMGGDSADAAEVDAPEEPLELEGPDGEPMIIENPSAPFIHDLGKFTVNLRGGGGGRTLRMQVQLQTMARYQLDVEDKTAALRDAVLTLASDYTYGDVEGLDGKQRLKDDLHAAVVKILPPEAVERLFFTEFVVN